jgi:hypothetical protein
MQFEPARHSPAGLGAAVAAGVHGLALALAYPYTRGTGPAVTRQLVEPQVSADASGTEAMALEDGELVRRCSRGEERAFERLFLRHRGSVTALVQRMLGPSAEVEDLVQDVFMQVLSTLGTFRE